MISCPNCSTEGQPVHMIERQTNELTPDRTTLKTIILRYICPKCSTIIWVRLPVVKFIRGSLKG